jgi:hypothetical protein
MYYSLKIIKEVSYEKYDTCVSCSLFRMTKSYRDFSKYIRDLNKIVKNLDKRMFIRLYIDESILLEPSFVDLFNSNTENLEIVFFEFPDFQVQQDGQVYHDGTFGTMARFLSLYQKPSLPNNIKYIWITDVDLPAGILDYSNIKEFKKDIHLSYFAKACNDREWIDNEVEFPILAGRIISKTDVEYPISDLEEFLSNVLNDKYSDLLTRIIRNREGRSHQALATHFTYGFDELFVNKYLYKTMQQYKRIVYLDILLDIGIDNEKLHRLEYQVYKNVKHMNARQKLIKFNRLIYDKVKNKNKDSYSYRIGKCVRDYETYKNKIDPTAVWGVTAKIEF